jgi:hypothetical protein
VRQALADVGRPVPADFDVAHYHRVVGDDKALHLAVVNRTKEFRQVEALPLPASLLEQRVSCAAARYPGVLSRCTLAPRHAKCCCFHLIYCTAERLI